MDGHGTDNSYSQGKSNTEQCKVSAAQTHLASIKGQQTDLSTCVLNAKTGGQVIKLGPMQQGVLLDSMAVAEAASPRMVMPSV